MNKKILAMFIVVTLSLSMYSLALPVQASSPSSPSSKSLPDYQPVDWRSGLAGTVAMPTVNAASDLQETDGAYAEANALAVGTTPPIGTKVYDYYLRSISRGTLTGSQPYMTLRAISGNVEVWTQDYLWFLPGDPRNGYVLNLTITDEMCQYLADEFNNIIYPTDTNSFGKPFDKDGTNTIFELSGFPSYYWNWINTTNPQRVILKVLNIRDANYYDPNYPYYTIGFYSPTQSLVYYNRNMIHIDCWQWWRRLGAEGQQWFPDHPELVVNRPHTYEGTVAHEFQHDIHQDWQPAGDLFMNEGCSMYAEYLCGFGIDTNDINSYFATPDNSLTQWGDQGDINILADYGAAELWAHYLTDHYGGVGFLTQYVQSGIPGIQGVDSVLSSFGYKVRFDDVYHNWRLANLIRSDFPGCGKYNYKSINLNDPAITQVAMHDINCLPVPWTRGTDFGTTKTILGYDTGVSMIGAYGSDYIKFQDWRKLALVQFNGDDSSVFGWTFNSTGGYWWSGSADLYNALLFGKAYVDPSNPVLTLVTMYGAESFWDFCFVQVSTDNGNTWTSLANEYATSDHDPSAHPDIVANLPGLTDYNPDWPSWTTMTFDLSYYSGQNVLIGFRYMTDWATTYEGWFIQGASVSGSALTLTPVYPDINFQVTLVCAIQTRCGTMYVPYDMWLNHKTETGWTLGYAGQISYVIMIVSPTMSNGWADYQFSVTPIRFPCFGCFRIL
ncbi:MAG: hypothetical protein WED05_00175 [Candidatus Atabeyarchaeum deiterrae]